MMMRQKTLRLLLVSTMSCGAFFSGTVMAQTASLTDCSANVGCDQKSCEIEKQISFAKENGNEHQLKGLNIALEEVNTYCTDENIKDDLKEEIEELNEEIAEDHSDLIEAKQDQKADKVDKYQRKIKEKEQEIEKLKKELMRIK
jgi:peptidoglycan hydrolase CwlO-like protein